jgi:hypothetical protein
MRRARGDVANGAQLHRAGDFLSTALVSTKVSLKGRRGAARPTASGRTGNLLGYHPQTQHKAGFRRESTASEEFADGPALPRR